MRAARTGCRITICRGCCCGTERKHPDVDSDGHVGVLRAAADVLVTDCLDVCGDSNVVVVQPSPAGRRAGGRPAWLGFLNDDDAVELVAAWVADGGPGVVPMPPLLDLHTIAPPSQR